MLFIHNISIHTDIILSFLCWLTLHVFLCLICGKNMLAFVTILPLPIWCHSFTLVNFSNIGKVLLFRSKLSNLWFWKRDIELIEQVQHRFTKRLTGMSGYSYDDRLKLLNLDSLQYRKTQFDIIMCYKIIFCLCVSTGMSFPVPLLVITIYCISILVTAQLGSVFSLNVLSIYGTACLLILLALPLCLHSRISWQLLTCYHWPCNKWWPNKLHNHWTVTSSINPVHERLLICVYLCTLIYYIILSFPITAI